VKNEYSLNSRVEISAFYPSTSYKYIAQITNQSKPQNLLVDYLGKTSIRYVTTMSNVPSSFSFIDYIDQITRLHIRGVNGIVGNALHATIRENRMLDLENKRQPSLYLKYDVGKELVPGSKRPRSGGSEIETTQQMVFDTVTVGTFDKLPSHLLLPGDDTASIN
jgi:hypothetical protein